MRSRIGNTVTIATLVAVQDLARSQTPNQTHGLLRLGVGHAQCLSHLRDHGPSQSRNLDPDPGLQLAVPAPLQNARFECVRLSLPPGV